MKYVLHIQCIRFDPLAFQLKGSSAGKGLRVYMSDLGERLLVGEH